MEFLHHLIVILKTDFLIHFYGIICKCKVLGCLSQITGVIQINDIGVLFTVLLCIGFGNFAFPMPAIPGNE